MCLWCSIQQFSSSGMESRGEAVSSEKLAAIEDEEVLNKMVSRPSFILQIKWGTSGLHAARGRVPRLTSSQTSWLICFTLFKFPAVFFNLHCVFLHVYKKCPESHSPEGCEVSRHILPIPRGSGGNQRYCAQE